MENKKELLKALADFQQDCPVIHKDTKGYNYTYTDLTGIFKVINPLLKKHDLGFTQLINDTIDTIVFHIPTGQYVESKTEIIKNVSLKGQNEFQTLGSQITYLKRYSISSILGIITDKDIDACGTQEPTMDEFSAMGLLNTSGTLSELKTNWSKLPKSLQNLNSIIHLKDEIKKNF